ncbi:MarR family winged helix-turn-helix transcriptional regulator [Paenibacillus fonticola]|uniref:MarR family winged helix-turn-helix transcriptional regulator n=1 Tax=Paenibacillus fonticola TaxID=379896 RepID=UPI00037E7323|nr:MarR family transcriptional regulator [Paenibacillus fonticola]
MEMDRMKSIFAKLDEINYALLHHYEEIIGHQLTPRQALVLEHVYRHTALSVNDLASKMNVTPGAISQLLAKLEQNKYIVRTINLKSRREIIVTMGEKGVDLYNTYNRIDQKIADEYYSKLHPDVMDQLERAVNELHTIVMSEEGRENNGLE